MLNQRLKLRYKALHNKLKKNERQKKGMFCSIYNNFLFIKASKMFNQRPDIKSERNLFQSLAYFKKYSFSRDNSISIRFVFKDKGQHNFIYKRSIKKLFLNNENTKKEFVNNRIVLKNIDKLIKNVGNLVGNGQTKIKLIVKQKRMFFLQNKTKSIQLQSKKSLMLKLRLSLLKYKAIVHEDYKKIKNQKLFCKINILRTNKKITIHTFSRKENDSVQKTAVFAKNMVSINTGLELKPKDIRCIKQVYESDKNSIEAIYKKKLKKSSEKGTRQTNKESCQNFIVLKNKTRLKKKNSFYFITKTKLGYTYSPESGQIKNFDFYKAKKTFNTIDNEQLFNEIVYDFKPVYNIDFINKGKHNYKVPFLIRKRNTQFKLILKWWACLIVNNCNKRADKRLNIEVIDLLLLRSKLFSILKFLNKVILENKAFKHYRWW